MLNKKITQQLTAITLVANVMLLSSAPVFAQSDLYQQGQKLLDEQAWNKAEKTFKKVVSKKNDDSDAAYYWLAYINNKQGEEKQALRYIDKLATTYPKSTWVDDAKILRIEIENKHGKSKNVDAIDNEELQLYAISSLMNASPEKATTMVTKILNGKGSKKIKNRALFVLSQIENDAVFSLMQQLANGEMEIGKTPQENTGFQQEAIKMLGVASTEQSGKVLHDIYTRSSNKEIKRSVLQALHIADAPAPLVDIIKKERDQSLREDAIQMLGVMNESQYLFEFYSDPKFIDDKETLLRAIGLSEDKEAINKIFTEAKTDEERLLILSQPTIYSEHDDEPILTSIYKDTKNLEIKKEVIRKYFIQENVEQLIAIYKTEKNTTLKREALQYLSHMDDDDASEFFNKVLEDIE